MKKRITGFTLIELLVVVSIIALLISILLPALNKAREQAKAVKCSSQMRQYSMAIYMYATEEGQIPWFHERYPALQGDKMYWYNILGPYLGVDESNADAADTELADTFQDLRECPTGKAWIGVHYGGFNNGPTITAPFVYGRDAINGGTSRPIRLEQISTPSAYLMLLDTQQFFVYSPTIWALDTDTDGDGLSDSSSPLTPVGPYNLATPKVHDGGCNVGLVDGHVERISFTELWGLDSNGSVSHQYWWNR